MATRAPSVCPYCGGAHLVSERCAPVVERDRQRKARHDERRPSARERGYGAKWDRARVDFLLEHPACRICGEPATVVDHIIPHRGSMVLFWDRRNWQPLCAHHHNSAKQSQDRRSSRKE